MSSIVENYGKASLALKSCGGWFCSGRNLNLPFMEINKKPVQFPLLSDECELFIKTSKAAPFGKSSQTIVDLNVRKAWQIDSDFIHLGTPYWIIFPKN